MKRGTKLGPRLGSRPWALINMKPGQRLFFEASPGRVSALMQQIAADISRNGLDQRRVQAHLLGVIPSTREVVDLIAVSSLDHL